VRSALTRVLTRLPNRQGPAQTIAKSHSASEAVDCDRAAATGNCAVSRLPRSSTTRPLPFASDLLIRARARLTRWCRPHGVAGRTSPKAAAPERAQARRDGGYRDRLAAARIAERQRVRDQQDLPQRAICGPPDCPLCGKPMVMRAARKGKNAGTHFWGCSAYPACHGTRPALAASDPTDPSD
jgi:Topoisomerase DNA binding C4 zinc finger